MLSVKNSTLTRGLPELWLWYLFPIYFIWGLLLVFFFPRECDSITKVLSNPNLYSGPSTLLSPSPRPQQPWGAYLSCLCQTIRLIINSLNKERIQFRIKACFETCQFAYLILYWMRFRHFFGFDILFLFNIQTVESIFFLNYCRYYIKVHVYFGVVK